MKKWFVLFLFVGLISLNGCSSSQGQSAMTFEKIGQQGNTVYLTLTSPSPSQVTDEELGNRLKTDWQNNLVNGKIEVDVYDNKEAPQELLKFTDAEWIALSDDDQAKELAQTNPHFIASYRRIGAGGQNTCFFYSRDATGKMINRIDY